MSSVEALKLAVGGGMPKMQAQIATGHSVSLNMESKPQKCGRFDQGIIKSMKNAYFAWRPCYHCSFPRGTISRFSLFFSWLRPKYAKITTRVKFSKHSHMETKSNPGFL